MSVVGDSDGKDSGRSLLKMINVRFPPLLAKIMIAGGNRARGPSAFTLSMKMLPARKFKPHWKLATSYAHDLLYGLMLRSGNDAAVLIAKNVFKDYDHFIYMMNETAKKIGMTDSAFANPSGLDEENANFSTCLDLALLMAYALDNNLFRKIAGTKTYSIITEKGNVIDCYNKHHLLHSLDYVSAGKTGYTSKAKRTLATSAMADGMELIAVTMNSNNDDYSVHRRLFEYGFSNYEMFMVLKRQIIKVNDDFYTETPIILEDIKYPVLEKENVTCTIKLLKNPGSKLIIGQAVIVVNGWLAHLH